MLLSKQPGDTGVFASATASHISIYAVSGSLTVQRAVWGEGKEYPCGSPIREACACDDAAPRYGRSDAVEGGFRENSDRPLSRGEEACDHHVPLQMVHSSHTITYSSAPPERRRHFGRGPSPLATSRWGSCLVPLRRYDISNFFGVDTRSSGSSPSGNSAHFTSSRCTFTTCRTAPHRRSATALAEGGDTDAAALDGECGSEHCVRGGMDAVPMHGMIPTSLSLSCASDQTRFFVSDQYGGGWIGSDNAPQLSLVFAAPRRMPGAPSILATTHSSDVLTSGTEGSAPLHAPHGSSATSSTLQHATRESLYQEGFCAIPIRDMSSAARCTNGLITSSGWDPRNAAILALGRQNGIVQLLDVEYAGGGAGNGNYCAGGSVYIDQQQWVGTQEDGRTRKMPAQSQVAASSPRVHYTTIQERLLQGPVTAMDWVPQSHLTVVAARRKDGLGYYAELLDLRSPESGIRHLGAPPGVFGTPHPVLSSRGAGNGGVMSHVLCYADKLACDPSKHYVATVGTQHNRDMVQLWDLRMCRRPVSHRVYTTAGYTSICWSLSEPMTVICTTMSGDLRVHSFADDCCSSVDDNGEIQSHMDRCRQGCGKPLSSCCSTHSRPHSGKETESEEDDAEEDALAPSVESGSAEGNTLFSIRMKPKSADKCDVQARMSSAAVAWVPQLSTPASHSENHPVGRSCRTNLPQLLLLNLEDGELYTQVYNRRGSVVTMYDGVPLVAGGPNVFSVSCTPPPPLPRGLPRLIVRSLDDGESTSSEMAAMKAGGMGCRLSLTGCKGSRNTLFEAPEADEGGPQFHKGATALSESKTYGSEPLHTSYQVDRVALALGRLRHGFSTNPMVNLEVLLKENEDRECYATFHYGITVTSYFFPSGVALPVNKVVPGLLELIMTEKNKRAHLGWSQTPLSFAFRNQDTRSQTRMPVDTGGSLLRNEVPGGRVYNVDPVRGSPTKHPSPSSQSLFVGALRQIILQAMSWVKPVKDSETSSGDIIVSPVEPGSGRDGRESGGRGTASADGTSPSDLLLPEDGIGMSSLQEAVERRVAILTLMGRLDDAAKLLLAHSSLHSHYPSIAFELSTVVSTGYAPSLDQHAVCEGGCSYWMSLTLSFVADVIAGRRSEHAVASPSSNSLAYHCSDVASPKTGGLFEFSMPASSPEEGDVPSSFGQLLMPASRDALNSVPQSTATAPVGRTASCTNVPVSTEAISSPTYIMEHLPADEQHRYVLSLLQRFPQMPISDQLGMAAALLLPPCYAEEHIRNLHITLQAMLQRQYYAKCDMALLANAVMQGATPQLSRMSSSACADTRLGESFGSCSLLLTTVVDGIEFTSAGLQRYVDETADVQSPLCYVAAFGPTRISAYKAWCDAYRSFLNNEGHSLLRCHHDLQSIKTGRLRGEAANTGTVFSSTGEAMKSLPALSGLELGMPSTRMSTHSMIKPSFRFHGTDRLLTGRSVDAPQNIAYDQWRSVELRCNCGQPMQTTALTKGANLTSIANTRKQVSPCGNPECRQWQTPMCTVCGERIEGRSMELLPERSFAWCTVCLHGGHWNHLRDWFAKHSKCPVEDCSCQCCEGQGVE